MNKLWVKQSLMCFDVSKLTGTLILAIFLLRSGIAVLHKTLKIETMITKTMPKR